MFERFAVVERCKCIDKKHYCEWQDDYVKVVKEFSTSKEANDYAEKLGYSIEFGTQDFKGKPVELTYYEVNHEEREEEDDPWDCIDCECTPCYPSDKEVSMWNERARWGVYHSYRDCPYELEDEDKDFMVIINPYDMSNHGDVQELARLYQTWLYWNGIDSVIDETKRNENVPDYIREELDNLFEEFCEL